MIEQAPAINKRKNNIQKYLGNENLLLKYTTIYSSNTTVMDKWGRAHLVVSREEVVGHDHMSMGVRGAFW